MCLALYRIFFISINVGGHVYHSECIRQFLNPGKRPLSKVCPSCRQPFEKQILLYLDLNEQPNVADTELTTPLIPAYPQEQSNVSLGDQGNILPDISYYEENMASLQQANDLLSAKLSDMEGIILLYHRRCNAQEEAKTELKRQIEELGSWIERLRHSDAEKEERLCELEDNLRSCDKAIKELEEERDTLSAENQHYQTLRVTDEYFYFLISV